MNDRETGNQATATKVIRCTCGVELRNPDERTLIHETQHHATTAHRLDLSDEQVRSMMEIDRSA
ncbi:MAG: hypothetical protein NVS4B2_23760 [Chloroflexota bacterium]